MRSEFGQVPDRAVGHTWEEAGQVLADGHSESAATLDHREDGGDFGSGLLAAQIQPDPAMAIGHMEFPVRLVLSSSTG